MKLGLKPPRPGSIQMKFGSYFKAADLPAVPSVFGRPELVTDWDGPLGNDIYGDCLWAGAAHETMLLDADAGNAIPKFTSALVLRDYGDATGFNPYQPGTDKGTDLQTGCAYRQKTGIMDDADHRHTIDIYTDLHPGDLNELDLAVYLLGIAGVGVNLPDNAETQFKWGEVWSIEHGAESIGGHYIPCIGRNSHGNYLFVTWGRLQAADPEWVQEYMDQGVAILSRERLKASGLSPQGFNLAQLEDDYHQLTGT